MWSRCSPDGNRSGAVVAPVLMLMLVLLATLTGCVGPARTDDAYRGKAATTLDAVRSSIETGIVGAHAAARHDLPAAYVSILMAEAEDDASAAQATFASIQPPSGRSDGSRRRTLAAAGDAIDLLTELRVTARRGDLQDLRRVVPRLTDAAKRLDDLATRLRS
jgi:hypothetical protein